MIRILQVSDVHLGAPLRGFGGHAAARGNDVREAFRGLPEMADRLEIDVVLLAGDLFDSPSPDAADVDIAREVLRDLYKGGARAVFAIPGNHDRCGSQASPWHSMPNGVQVILEPRFGPPRTVDVGDTRLHVYGVAFDPAIEPDPLAGYSRSSAEGLHVVLLHAGLLDNPDWKGGHGLRLPGSALEALDADYVALGDYHGCRMPGEMPGGRSCYSGSLAAVRVGETGIHGAMVVELGNGTVTARLEPSRAPQLVEFEPIDVSNAGSDLEVADRVGALVERSDRSGKAYPVIRIVGEPAFPLDASRVTDSLGARFGFAVVSDETRFIDSDRLQALAMEPSVVGHVARLGLHGLEEAKTDVERQVAERALRIALRALEEA